jgi:D-aspartate ligase
MNRFGIEQLSRVACQTSNCMQFDNSIPVLLMCCNTPVGAIGGMRTLGRLGIPVYAIDLERRGRVWSSRYCIECFPWDPLNSPPEESLERLLHIGRQLKARTLLVPTFDEAAIFVAEHYDCLKQYFIYPQQEPELIRSLVSKKETYFLANQCGVPVPEAIWPRSRQEVLDFAERAQFPVALKAIRGLRLKLKAGITAFIVRSAEELIELYDRFEDHAQPNLMIQEYIPGTDSCGWGFNGYFNDRSECLLGGTTRRLHQSPVHVGVTSLAVIERNDEVDCCARAFMTAIGFRGMVNIGFRYDARDGQYKVVDVNPRLGSSFRSFVTQNGMDILRACYLDLTGQSVPTGAPVEGRKWILELDVRSCLSYHREGQSFPSLFGRYRGVGELAYFSLTDPLPLFSMCVSGLSRPLRHWWKSRGIHSNEAKTSSAFGA